MSNEIIKEQEVNDADKMYLETIEDLKSKMDNDMISKEEYDKLLSDHKKLLNDSINKRPIVKPVENTKTAEELSKTFVNENNLTNREYVKKLLDYRTAYMNEFRKDPFDNPVGEYSDPQKAEMVANEFKELLDNYTDDTEFRIKLNTLLKDDPSIRASINRQRK